MNRDQMILSEIIRTAKANDGDLAAACNALLNSGRSSLARSRKAQRRGSFATRELWEKRCKRLLDNHKRIRRMARKYGWELEAR